MIDKALFIKVVSDANKVNGFYMDDYTAELLYGHFYEMEFKELDAILNKLMRNGERVTYKTLSINKAEQRKMEPVQEYKEIVYECKDNCKECKRDVVCVQMNNICWDYVRRIKDGIIHWKQAMEELHMTFPHVGFDKKIGTCTGVIWDANGEHIPIYKYD